MRIVSLVAIFLLGLCPAYAGSRLSGVWALNRAKSNFGAGIAPEQFVVRLERTGSRLATWRITTDTDGQHLVYREYTLEGKRRSSVELARSRPISIEFPKVSTGRTRIDERWQVSKAGELIIHRSVINGRRTVHQRLVLEPSTQVQGINQDVREN